MPFAPYAYCGVHVSVHISPTAIDERPTSQPPITLPSPSVNLNGFPRAREESKVAPVSSSRPS